MLASALRLPLQLREPGRDLFHQQPDALDVLMRRLQPVLRLLNLQPVALDVRCLFDEQPPFLWAKVQDTLDESLPDDRVRALGSARLR